MANWYVSTHPGSDFRARLFVARHPPGRRLTLLGNQFTIRESGGKTDTRTLRDAQEIATLLEQEFLINLPQPRSELMAAIERSIAS
jgi:N-hydroxyarylamine O-acetyltransferase